MLGVESALSLVSVIFASSCYPSSYRLVWLDSLGTDFV